jgi:hypothetical protein
LGKLFDHLDSKVGITLLSNWETLIIVTNKRCLKLVEKVLNESVVTNSIPNGIFTSNRGR